MSMTKLEAVNLMLDAIGETPVSSLAAGLPDAVDAERILDRTSREVQAKGWHCNTDENLPTQPDENGKIAVSTDWLREDTAGVHAYIDVVRRDDNGTMRLFDRKEQTFVFSVSPVYMDIVRLLDYEALTPELQTYIAYTAAGKYQKAKLGSTALSNDIKEEISLAWAGLCDAEGLSEDLNVLFDNEATLQIVYRNNYLFGR